MNKFGVRKAIFVVGSLLIAFSLTLSVSAADFSVNATADGAESLVLSDALASFNISLVTTEATACEMTAPALSGVATGASFDVVPGDSWYPAAGGSTTFTFSCNDSTGATLSDSVTVSLAASPAAVPTVDIKANDSDGPVTITNGDPYTLSWNSSDATACEITAPSLSGVSLSGSSVIDPTHPWYPATSSPVTITISCVNEAGSDTDSVEINLDIVPPALPVTADIKANGSDGPIDVTDGNSFSYSWTSANATACELTSPALSGIALSGSNTVNPGDIWYPAAGDSMTFTISCTDGTETDIDSVVVNIISSGGDGGGGSEGGGSCPLPSFISSLSVSGRVGEVFSYTLAATSTSSSTPVISLNASSLPSGLSYSSSTNIISGTPTTEGTFNISISVTSSCGTVSDVLVITIAPANTDGDGSEGSGGGGSGGGGGGGGGSSRPGDSSRPPAVASISTGTFCPYLTDYMRIDFNNNPTQVIYLQSFLKYFEGYDYVQVNGVFDDLTFRAVSEFQEKYREDVLEPWAEGQTPTGYVYILTLRKINELICGPQAPISVPQAQEIEEYVPTPGIPAEVGVIEATSSLATAESPPKGQNLAAAIFAIPDSFTDASKCLYGFVLVLIVLYILGNVLRDVLYKNDPKNVLKRFYTKWITIVSGLTAAIVLAYILQKWCIVLPLLIALIFGLVWTLLFNKHESLKNSVKAWYLVIAARTRTFLNS